MVKSKKIKETHREGQLKGQNSEGTKKEGEEKNNSSTQAKWGRREKSFLITQENFWCEYKWGMRVIFIGEEVDENGKTV